MRERKEGKERRCSSEGGYVRTHCFGFLLTSSCPYLFFSHSLTKGELRI